jgi:hypothetical protein
MTITPFVIEETTAPELASLFLVLILSIFASISIISLFAHYLNNEFITMENIFSIIVAGAGVVFIAFWGSIGSELLIVLLPIGTGLIIGSVLVLLLIRVPSAKGPFKPTFAPNTEFPTELVYSKIYQEENNKNGFTKPVSWEELEKMGEKITSELHENKIIRVEDDPIYSNKDQIRELVQILFEPKQKHQNDLNFEAKLTSVRADLINKSNSGADQPDYLDTDEEFIEELDLIQNNKDLNSPSGNKATAHRLIQTTKGYLRGTKNSSDIAEVFADTVDDLQEKDIVEERVNIVEQSLRETADIQELSNRFAQQAKSLNDTKDLEGATKSLFLELSNTIEDTREHREEYRDCERRRQELANRLSQLDSELNENWIKEHTKENISDEPGSLVETGVENGIVGELVTKEAAKSIKWDSNNKFNRGSLTKEFLDTISRPNPRKKEEITKILQKITDKLQEYSRISLHFESGLTGSEVEQRGNNLTRTAAKLDLPGIDDAVDRCVEDELRSLKTTPENDFVAFNISDRRFEFANNILEEARTGKSVSRDTNIDIQTSVDEKKQELESKRNKYNIGGTGVIIMEHLRDLLNELENQANRADSESEREALLTAAEITADYIIQMYQNPDLEDALVFLDT